MPHIPSSPRRGHPARPRRDDEDTQDQATKPLPTPHSYGQSAPMPGEIDEHDPEETMEDLSGEPEREDETPG